MATEVITITKTVTEIRNLLDKTEFSDEEIESGFDEAQGAVYSGTSNKAILRIEIEG